MLHSYLELKLSWELFQKAPDALSDPERSKLAQVANKQNSIEQGILRSAEAASVIVPAAAVNNRLADIRQRYASEEEFTNDMLRSGLDEASLGQAVERDLRVESVLDKIAAGVAAADSVEAEIYYRLHPDAFDRPESRRLRHILITFDSSKGKNKASRLLDELRSKLRHAEQFAAAALSHSQCPTAMEGGLLGVVKRQQLYAELEPAAFALAEGEISAVLESPIGLHILRCDEILPSGMLPFADVSAQIIERLTDKRRRDAQREWIKRLLS